MKTYVKHISGRGDKWAVVRSSENGWEVRPINDLGRLYIFPKSEFVICDPPEIWKEVGVQIVEEKHAKDARDPGCIYDGGIKIAKLLCGGKYRIKTLIVEKKVTE